MNYRTYLRTQNFKQFSKTEPKENCLGIKQESLEVSPTTKPKNIRSFSKPGIDKLFFNNLTGKYVIYNDAEYHVDNVDHNTGRVSLFNPKTNAKLTRTFSNISEAYKSGNLKFQNKVPNYK